MRYGLSSAEELPVASIGGYVKEYQVDVDPDAMKANNINLEQVIQAIPEQQRDVGAKPWGDHLAEYFVRGLGYVKNIGDIEKNS